MTGTDPVRHSPPPGDASGEADDREAGPPAWITPSALLASAPDPVVVLDGELRIRWIDGRVRDVLDLPDGPSGFAGHLLWEVDPALAETPLERAVRGALGDGRVHAVHRMAAGRRRLDARVVPTPPGLTIHLRDVSCAVATECALRHEAHRYRQLVEHSSDVVLVLDADGMIRYASPSVTRAVGHPPSAVEGRPLSDFVHPHDVTALLEAFARALLTEDERPTAVRARVRAADGGWRVAEAVGQLLWPAREGRADDRPGVVRAERPDGSVSWSAGHPAGAGRPDAAGPGPRFPTAVVTVRDITERAAAEQALRASEAHYRELIEQLGDGIAVIDDGDGRLTMVNARLSEITGYSPGELLRMRVGDLLVAAAGDDPADRGGPLASAGAPLARRRMRRRDGTLLTAEITTRRIGARVQAVVRDVTERELFEERRRAAQKLEALGLLAGSVAHDFNNFLHAIQCSVELALGASAGGPGSAAVEAELEDIRRVVRRAAGLTRQLLTIGGKQTSQPATFRLGDAVTGMEQMLRRLLPATVELVVRGADRSRHVRADVGQVEQVVMNLVMNARDAMPTGGVVTVALRSRRATAPIRVGLTGQVIPPGDYAVLSVSDTGTGMSPETVARAFEPLFTTRTAGTGLGLWTVQSMATEARGYVSVESAPGAGSTFELWLPAVAAGGVAGAAHGDEVGALAAASREES